MGKRRFTLRDVERELPNWAVRQIKEQLNETQDTRNQNTEHVDSKQKRGGRKALELEGTATKVLDYPYMPLLVRITRVGSRRLDDDNLSGGCKQLRDAIASLLGRKGDSEREGLYWEYKQEKGKPQTIIEVFEYDDERD